MSKSLMFVGGRNRDAAGNAIGDDRGISVYRLDGESGVIDLLSRLGEVDNPTFLALSPDGRLLATVSEREGAVEGSVSTLAIDSHGKLRLLGTQPSGGFTPAHLSFDNTGRYLAAVNYTDAPLPAASQSVRIFRLDADGAPGDVVGEASHTGKGEDRSRQDRPHAHCVRWTLDNRFVVVADLGIDRLVVHRFDATTGRITRHRDVVLPAGSGPRHFLFHPTLPFAYVVNELSNTVASLAFDAANGAFRLLAEESALPTGVTKESYCSAIAVAAGGRHLFAGNRGHDSIARFDIDASGIARFIRTMPCGGKWPRDFAFDPSGRVLAVANQQSDAVSLFRYDPQSGALTPLGEPIASNIPTAIVFRPQPD